jgi:hypothetical protein
VIIRVTGFLAGLAILAGLFFPRELITALNIANSAGVVLLVIGGAGLTWFAARGARQAVPQLYRDVTAIWRYQRGKGSRP